MFAFQAFKLKCNCCNGSYYKIRFLQKRDPEPEEICMTSSAKTASNGLGPLENQDAAKDTDCITDMPADEKLVDNGPEKKSEKPDTTSGKKTSKRAGTGFLIILFYYFQDALLLHVDTGTFCTLLRIEQM